MIKLKHILNEITLSKPSVLPLVKGQQYDLKGPLVNIKLRVWKGDQATQPGTYIGLKKAHKNVGSPWHTFQYRAGWRDIVLRLTQEDLEDLDRQGNITPVNTINEIIISQDPFGLEVGTKYDIAYKNSNGIDCLMCTYQGYSPQNEIHYTYAMFRHFNGSPRAYVESMMREIIEKNLITVSKRQ